MPATSDDAAYEAWLVWYRGECARVYRRIMRRLEAGS